MSLSRRYGIILVAYHGSFHDGKELYTMSNVKRKDSKNRNLRNGESQRKDGRYVYKYTDIYGKPQFIYSWKLVPTDKTPAGKRDDISLREKEAQIKKDLNDGIDTVGGKMTVCQLYDKKNSQRKNIKRATEKGRQYLMNALKNDPLGMRAIDTVKQSDAKEWAIRMSEKGYAYKTIDNYKRSLKASFYMAIQDDCIRKNPFEFKLSDVLEDDTEQKVILTPEQEECLLAFMEKDKIYSKYYDEVVLLLETGLRISEFCGLTTHIDMQNRILNIDHQLLKDSEMGYYIETPKWSYVKKKYKLNVTNFLCSERSLTCYFYCILLDVFKILFLIFIWRQISTVTVNAHGIIKCFDVFKNQFMCMCIIKDFKPIDPFSLQKCMERFYTGVIPWICFL